jgi:hypothetical protein
MERELHRDLLAERGRLPSSLVLVNSKTVKLSSDEVQLNVMEEVITGLAEVSFSRYRSEVEVSLVYAFLGEGLSSPPYQGVKETGDVYTRFFVKCS